MMQPKPKKARRWLATAAMAGVASYIVIDVVLQFLPPHYSVLHDAESNLAVGPFGWIMNLNFLGRGVTTLCAIAAINRVGHASGLRRSGVFLLAVGGVCSATLAFFPTDVVPGSGLVAVTTPGTVHLFVAGLGFLAALAGIVLLTGWIDTVRELQGTYRAALTLAIITALGLVLLGLSAILGSAFLGLAERVCLLGVLGWVVVICRAIRVLPSRA